MFCHTSEPTLAAQDPERDKSHTAVFHVTLIIPTQEVKRTIEHASSFTVLLKNSSTFFLADLKLIELLCSNPQLIKLSLIHCEATGIFF